MADAGEERRKLLDALWSSLQSFGAIGEGLWRHSSALLTDATSVVLTDEQRRVWSIALHDARCAVSPSS